MKGKTTHNATNIFFCCFVSFRLPMGEEENKFNTNNHVPFDRFARGKLATNSRPNLKDFIQGGKVGSQSVFRIEIKELKMIIIVFPSYVGKKTADTN